jgi:hypothetical protein
MARPAKITSEELNKYIIEYVDVQRTVNNGVARILNRNDKDVAAEISIKSGIEVNRNQIVYWRRKYNIAACCENWGGQRNGAGRKQENMPISVPYDGITVVDYASGYAAVQLLHKMDTFRLSREWIPSMTNDKTRPEQKARIKLISENLRKINKSNAVNKKLKILKIQNRIPKIPEEIQKIPIAVGAEDMQEIFESADMLGLNGKKNNNENKVNVATTRALSMKC